MKTIGLFWGVVLFFCIMPFLLIGLVNLSIKKIVYHV